MMAPREMGRRLASVLVFSMSAGVAGSSLAAQPDCPPDEWFCEESAPASPDSEDASEPDGAEPASAEPGQAGEESWSDATSPPARAPNTPPNIDLDTSAAEVKEPEGEGAAQLSGRSKWSANLRIEGVMLEQRSGRSSTGLGGVGASLRYRISPVVTLDGGIDLLLGSDYEGYDRTETVLSFSTLLYLNPTRLVRTYALLGVHSSVADVEVDAVGSQSWSYLGAQAGLGVEVPLDWRVALNLDLLGFIRGRTDARAAREPEFTDDSGRVTNLSGGGLFRAGVSLRW